MTMAVEKLKKNDTIDCSRLLSTTSSLLNSPYLTYSQRGRHLKVFGLRKEQARMRERRVSG